MQFRIFDAASGGNVLWGPESLTPTVTNGVFSVQLGASPALTPEVFTTAAVYLGVTVDPDVYPGGEMSPRSRLVASPYAVTAAQLAQSGDIRINSGVAYATFTNAGNLLLPIWRRRDDGDLHGPGHRGQLLRQRRLADQCDRWGRDDRLHQARRQRRNRR